MKADVLLERLCIRYREILGDNFIGMYVHGSYALGCFNPAKSDLDYIVVCENVPDISAKRRIMDVTIAYERLAPVKGLEMHVMCRDACLHPGWPPRFELHYSPAHTLKYLGDPDGYIGCMRGGDVDLGAHLTVMKARGLAIAGPAISDIFGDIPRERYIESVVSDMEWSDNDAMYHVLNRCRTLALAKDGLILSKAEGAAWALSHVEEKFQTIIREALACYAGDGEMSDIPSTKAFCEHMAREIFCIFNMN